MSMLQTLLDKVCAPGQQTHAQELEPQQQHGLLEGIAGLIPQVGGLAGLAQLFQKQGLGHIVSGWIGNGPNPPVSGGQLQQVLGSDRIAAIARKLGMDPEQASAHLAAVLPHAVDHLTPDGKLPQEQPGTQDIIGSLKRKFLGV